MISSSETDGFLVFVSAKDKRKANGPLDYYLSRMHPHCQNITALYKDIHERQGRELQGIGLIPISQSLCREWERRFGASFRETLIGTHAHAFDAGSTFPDFLKSLDSAEKCVRDFHILDHVSLSDDSLRLMAYLRRAHQAYEPLLYQIAACAYKEGNRWRFVENGLMEPSQELSAGA